MLIIRLVLLTILCVSPSLTAAQLKFGVYTADKASDVVLQFRPILNQLELEMTTILQETVSIKMRVYGDYQQGIDAIVNGEVDFTRTGAASFIIAKRQQPALSLLAREQVKGKEWFEGIICVHSDSVLQSVGELSGHSFAFGNENSTIGRYLAQNLLLEKGINVTALKSYAYLGRHDKVAAAVAAGDYDAGSVKSSTYNKLLKQGAPLRSLTTIRAPTKPWFSRAKLPSRYQVAISKALLRIDAPSILNALEISGMMLATEDNFLPMRSAMDSNEAFFAK